MQKRLSNALAACVACGCVGDRAAWDRLRRRQSRPAGRRRYPRLGSMAPDFTLNYFDGNDLKSVSLSQYRGKKNVVVAFFIFAFTGG